MADTTSSVTSRIQAFLAQGPRTTLEDRYFIDEKEGKYVLWGICDGHNDKGRIAEIACHRIPQLFSQAIKQQRADMPRLFSQILSTVQKEIEARQLPGGSTALINYLDFKTRELFVATLGDTETRLCKIRETYCKLEPLSIVCDWSTPEDEARAYSFTEEAERLGLQEEWSETYGKSRYFKEYNVSRALGHLNAIDDQGKSPFSLEPKVTSSILEKGTIVIAASDGLWDYIKTPVIEMVASFDKPNLAEAIGKFALMNSKDNVTVLTLKV